MGRILQNGRKFTRNSYYIQIFSKIDIKFLNNKSYKSKKQIRFRLNQNIQPQKKEVWPQN